MSDVVEVIERVLEAEVLSAGLTVIPARGAGIEELDEEERLLGRPLSRAMKRLLSRWNGLDLDVVRLYGCGSVVKGIRRLSTHQIRPEPHELRDLDGPLIIGSDPSGFVYIEDRRGPIWYLDSDGGDLARLADTLDDFLSRVVFGRDAETFGGKEWAQTLRQAGLVP